MLTGQDGTTEGGPWRRPSTRRGSPPGTYSVFAWLRSMDGGPDYPAEAVGSFVGGGQAADRATVVMDGPKSVVARFIEVAEFVVDRDPWGLARLAYCLDAKPLEIHINGDGVGDTVESGYLILHLFQGGDAE